MPPNPTWVHDALLAAIAGRAPAAAPAGATDWEGLAAAASAHGVQGWVARTLRGAPEVPPDFQLPLQSAALRIAANHRRLLEETAHALRGLRAGGVGAVVFKGPALVERYYDDERLRSYGDVDLLVRPRDFPAAVRALEEDGYRVEDRNWDFLVEDLRGQIHLLSPRGATVELHWHVVNGSRQRRTLGMGPEELWDATEPAELAGESCLVLAREDEIAHLALHAAMHGCNRLVWLLDLAAVCAAPGLRWDRVAARLRRWRFGSGGGLVLWLASRWAGAGVPEELVAELVGPASRAAARRMEARWDLGAPGEVAQARALFFATAGDDAVTRARLAAEAIVPAHGQQPRGRTGAAYRASIGAFRRVKGKLFATDHRDALAEYVPVGDPEHGRARFLADVAAVSPEGAARRVVVVSPSRSIGMSHYTHALAGALEKSAGVEVLDAATDGAPSALARRWWLRDRKQPATRLLVTSPHWSLPALLLLTGWRGGFVWHDPILDAASRTTRPLHTLYYRLVTKRLGTVVLHGEVFRARVRELSLPATEVVVVPHGFVPDELVSAADYDPAGPLLFAGRLHPYKGLGVLLDALARLGDDPPPTVIGGHGIGKEMIPRELARVDVRPGELPDEELRDLIGSCSAVLLPYERANQSGVLATAFRSGRPVVASRVGSFAEYVHDGVNGLLVPPGDPAALADAMARLRGDPALARSLAAGALRTWEEELSPEGWAGEIVDALFR